jgi:hypothetical protein
VWGASVGSRNEVNPLYGAAVLNWDAVAAPVIDAVDYHAPPANSLDPGYPGVLVRSSSDETMLLIGTLSNLRSGQEWLDGAGITLRVAATASNRLRGTWGARGIVRGGTGYFCADPVAV